MTKVEDTMAEILRESMEFYGYTAVRAEPEAEGPRMGDLLRFVEMTHAADLSCETGKQRPNLVVRRRVAL